MSVNEVKLNKAAVEFEVKGGTNAYSRTFCIGDEDHTLGNSLRHILMQHQGIDFAGYSVPHPSEPMVQIRVQTSPDYVPATDALQEAAETLADVCDILLERLEQEMPSVAEDSKQRNIILQELDEDDEDEEEDEEMEDD